MSTFIAVDFGAGSGRVIAGQLRGNQMKLNEIHRFKNRPVQIGNHLYWNFPLLFEEMKNGLKKAALTYNDIVSIGIDTWGVDYGLVDKAGNLMGNPICYRDEMMSNFSNEILKKISFEKHYAKVGIQVMPINTLFQLYARKKENENWLSQAEHLLFMPDLFAYYLTGVPGNEYCIASTSELLDARNRTWDFDLIQQLELPIQLFGQLLQPGEIRGTLLPHVANELGLLPTVKVVAVGSHDTASAVYAVPFQEGKRKTSAFLSSGTWSLLGVELDDPILTEEARLAGFTNEGGIGGKIRFLQNITGLWMLQCLIKEWDEKKLETDYEFLISEAEKIQNVPFIDVDDPDFQHPMCMEKAIVNYCCKHDLTPPIGQGEFVRCILQSLAERYRKGIEALNTLLDSPIENLHIIGGGSQNKLLNRLTEEFTGISVFAGPVEATATGNLLLQAEVHEGNKNIVVNY